jgi:hypothetical protein
MTATKPIFAIAAFCSVGLFAAHTDFDRLISQIVAQLDQQAESDQRLVDQTVKLRKSLQAAEDQLAKNQLPNAREQVVQRASLIAANEMIANPKRTKLQLDAFLRGAWEQEETILAHAVDGPAATRLETVRLAAQIKARQSILRDLRRDVEALRKFPTAQERLAFLKDNVELIWQAVRQRSGNVSQ